MKAKAVDEKIGLQKHEDYGLLLLSIGKVHMDQGKPDRAFAYFTDSKKTYDTLGIRNHANYAELMSEMAKYYEKKGDKKSAGGLYRKSYGIYEATGFIGEAKDAARKNAERLGY
jgi:tetratricopeptide (TPR) repeat protein